MIHFITKPRSCALLETRYCMYKGDYCGYLSDFHLKIVLIKYRKVFIVWYNLHALNV